MRRQGEAVGLETKMPLPISVVIPHKTSRRKFFVEKCLPSVFANDPSEVIVIANDGSEGAAGRFRNWGFEKTSCRLVIFVDDDTVLLPDCLAKMLAAVDGGDAAFAYSDFKEAVYHYGPEREPVKRVVKSFPWDPERLRRGNYISTVSLIRRIGHPSIMPRFDASIRKLDDWDLWLTFSALGARGIYIPEPLFESHVVDQDRISNSESDDAAIKKVKAKWGIP
jgi:glycosyltransferase involved in cell wall biosynthesis